MRKKHWLQEPLPTAFDEISSFIKEIQVISPVNKYYNNDRDINLMIFKQWNPQGFQQQ